MEEPVELTPELVVMLKALWDIDTKRRNGTATVQELTYLRKNKSIIVDYYENQSRYWEANDGKLIEHI